jgi:dTDP-4-dehydrorhamnose 3,5-epimerase-like enzyme
MSSLEDVHWIDLPSHRDARGVLTSVESETDIPFTIRRIFYLHHVVTDRGGHAHRDTDQVIIAVSGSLKVDLSDSTGVRTYEICDPTRGLYMPRMIFAKLYAFSPDAACLVLANTHYDMSKSIRSWQEYLTAIGERLVAE